jgi:hypothetical protein
MKAFTDNNIEIAALIRYWEPRLQLLPEAVIGERRNGQNRTVRMILGHLCDSASNNLHRIIHLQYNASPVAFPDYANLGNNDRWIAIQSYQDENWDNIIQLWKYLNFHLIHVIEHVNEQKLNAIWISALKQEITLQNMILDYLRHLRLHLDEIDELITNS